MSEPQDKSVLVEMTTDIVSAYLGQNKIAVADLPAFIKSIHGALASVAAGVPEVVAEKREPAVSIRRSITPDFLICLEDGRKFKSLKRHLRTKYELSPEDYRAKWGLPKDYPMVAPSYAAARSDLAKKMGLGAGGRQPAKPAAKTPAKPAAKARTAKAK